MRRSQHTVQPVHADGDDVQELEVDQLGIEGTGWYSEFSARRITPPGERYSDTTASADTRNQSLTASFAEIEIRSTVVTLI